MRQLVRLKRREDALRVRRRKRVLQKFRALHRGGGDVRPRPRPVVRAEEAHARARVERSGVASGENVRDVRGVRGPASAPQRVAERGDHGLVPSRAVRGEDREVLAPAREETERVGGVWIAGEGEGGGGGGGGSRRVPGPSPGSGRRRAAVDVAADEFPRRAREHELERVQRRPGDALGSRHRGRGRREVRLAHVRREQERVRPETGGARAFERRRAFAAEEKPLHLRRRRRRRGGVRERLRDAGADARAVRMILSDEQRSEFRGRGRASRVRPRRV